MAPFGDHFRVNGARGGRPHVNTRETNANKDKNVYTIHEI